MGSLFRFEFLHFPQITQAEKPLLDFTSKAGNSLVAPQLF